jgi:hypothetical protein
MKPEPLKNKSLSSIRDQHGEMPFIFYGKDIKSAVEWLKENINTNINEVSARVVNAWIDKAFEDVINGGDKNGKNRS